VPDANGREERLAVDKSQLAIGTPKRVRDADHLAAVRRLSFLICERTPSHAHHLKFA
jgi:hypothetical protein